MKIVVAGANGFLGSRVTRALLATGHEVVAMVGSRSDLTRLNELAPLISLRYHDRQSLAEITAECEAVVNAAVCYGRGGADVSAVVEGNILFPLQLLEQSAANSCRTFISFGTYFQRARNYGVLQPYINSKRHFPEYARPLAKELGIRLVNLTLEHLYGSGDGADKFVPRLIADCLAGVPVIPMTAGEQVRDFIHVDDAARACVTVLENAGRLGRASTMLEVGSGSGVSIRRFAEMVCEQCNSTSRLDFGALPYRRGEIMNSVADIRRMERLGWRQMITLKEGIADLISNLKSAGGK